MRLKILCLETKLTKAFLTLLTSALLLPNLVE